ncbi:MAG TPA: MotA/TolQ/ExbB proton channel family protein [Opitutales bacterium]|nr:MotA/TolQ/ExbB proton channel family protein [Opitutales bacterium]HOO92946.1 MotA/TolQ/ExbB proton channel family protein [Opitutales bacterium]
MEGAAYSGSQGFIADTVALWVSGGWLMIPLAVIACFIYWTAFSAYFYFTGHKFYRVPKEHLVKWVLNPILASGEIRDIIDYTQSDVRTPDEVRSRFGEILNAYLARLDRQRAYLYVLIGTAPLMGLLGTVTGMLSTFQSMSAGGRTDTIDLIAGGISEALITTQTGLVIAIPAYIIAYLVLKRRNEMEACLISMETMTVQLIEKRQKQPDIS